MPNLALPTRDVEAFEDTPLEYVRAELHVSEVATPRQAAADVVKVLGGVGADSKRAMTKVLLEWIRRALPEASAGRGGEDAWKSKDATVYLFEAIATRSGTLTACLSLSLCADCAELSESAAHAARRDGYEFECKYRAVVRGQYLWRPPGCRGWWRPPGVASRCNQVPLHVPLSGVLCFFGEHWLFEPLTPTTAHEGTTGLGTSVAT